MSRSKGLRLFSFLVLLVLIASLSLAVFADTSATAAPPVTNGTAPISSTDGPFGTSPESTVTPPTSAQTTTTKTPESSSMLNPDLTTTPDTADKGPLQDGKDNKFSYTGLIIALAIAGAVILLVILLVPKNKDKR